MSKKVVVELTVEQALALWTMIASSDMLNTDEDDGQFTPTMQRALAKFEDAIEATGRMFAHRKTERKVEVE